MWIAIGFHHRFADSFANMGAWEFLLRRGLWNSEEVASLFVLDFE